MDKMRKGRLAKRAKSFKEDIIDILSNLRSPTSIGQNSEKVKQLPISTHVNHGTEKQNKSNLVLLVEQITSSPGLAQNHIGEISSNVLQLQRSLKYFEDVVRKKAFELLHETASVVLEVVYNISTTIDNIFPTGEQHSSSLISATSSVNQTLSNLLRWSDSILLETTTKESSLSPVIEPTTIEEIDLIVDGLANAVYDLVQIVLHKISNKPLPPLKNSSESPKAILPSSPGFEGENDNIDTLDTSIKRTSKSSEGSLTEDFQSTDWSSESLVEECDPIPPPKPPLPIKSLLKDFEILNSMTIHDFSPPPPPLPPKKRSQIGAGFAATPNTCSVSPGWTTPTLPDLVPNQFWHTQSHDSLSHSSVRTQEVFHRQVESQWQEHHKNVSVATSSSSVFSSSSSFTSYNIQSSSARTAINASVDNSNDDHVVVLSVPPALPVKRRQRAMNRLPSQYDNVDQIDGSPSCLLADFIAVRQEHSSSVFHFSEAKQLSTNTGNCSSDSVQVRREYTSHVEQQVALGNAPPLPPKKRHIMAYMEMVGQYSNPGAAELFRQSMEVYQAKAAEWQEHSEDVSLTRKNFLPPPPLLPPKKNKISSSSTVPQLQSESSEKAPNQSLNSPPLTPAIGGEMTCSGLAINGGQNEAAENENGMEKLELNSDLVFKSPEDEGPEVRGGSVDALIIHATISKKDEYHYQDAFLATYRTFISPLDLIKKLIHRFHYFQRKPDITHQRTGRIAFSLLVLVVDDLALSELDEPLLRHIIEFQSHLVSSGYLILAKPWRKKFLEKCTTRRLRNLTVPVLSSLDVSTRQSNLLEFKSGELAEQMTLLDAELFLRIEIPEVLIWAQEQNEERSPNLTLFTEHFNKMSYWARSKILTQQEAKDRERYVVKFIKIMKHLRCLNNFNSYLALLSALDSAPVRRLEWQKSITDGLQEYCALIDSSSSFRAYRQALAETQPPCIPYIGLILQDLTFVHIGNPDVLSDDRINFGKRWQQYHILENMRRFQKCNYQFKRNERIVAFFNDFNDSLSEEAMWQISEGIRPRGSNNNTAKK